MAFIDEIERIKRIDNLIRLKATGNADELALKLNLSRKMIYNYINLMKGLGAPIKYDKYRQSYIYLNLGNFSIGFNKEQKV